MNREEYLKQREEYEEGRSQQSDLLDKHLLTITTGSFGLSFLFVEKVANNPIVKPEILIMAWVFFACSVISSLLSFVCSKNAFKKAIQELDEQYENPNHVFNTSYEDYKTTTFNVFSFIFLILGFAAFILFAYFNIMRG